MKWKIASQGQTHIVDLPAIIPAGQAFACQLGEKTFEATWDPRARRLIMSDPVTKISKLTIDAKYCRIQSSPDEPAAEIDLYFNRSTSPKSINMTATAEPYIPGLAQKKATSQQNGILMKAPMTGTIIKVEVAVGAEVTQGQLLLIVEAMKMENRIEAKIAGKIEQVMVVAGQKVNLGAPLVKIK